MLLTAAKSYGDKNVVLLGASVDSPETQGKVGAYVQKLQITYPIWVGGTDVDMKRLQIGDEVPATLFLDEKGIVRARILGQMRPGEIENDSTGFCATSKGKHRIRSSSTSMRNDINRAS